MQSQKCIFILSWHILTLNVTWNNDMNVKSKTIVLKFNDNIRFCLVLFHFLPTYMFMFYYELQSLLLRLFGQEIWGTRGSFSLSKNWINVTRFIMHCISLITMFPYNDYSICCTFMRYSFVSRFKKVYASTGSIFRLDSMPSFMNSVAGI